jgi:hypothetical protein
LSLRRVNPEAASCDQTGTHLLNPSHAHAKYLPEAFLGQVGVGSIISIPFQVRFKGQTVTFEMCSKAKLAGDWTGLPIAISNAAAVVAAELPSSSCSLDNGRRKVDHFGGQVAP